MRKAGLLVVFALVLFGSSGGGVFAQATGPAANHPVTITLNEQNGSGQTGTATLTEANGQLMVSINLSNGSSTPQPAHIHKGTCANLDPVPTYPLTSIVDGKSETTLTLTMATLSAGQYAINVHKSGAEAKIYVACGDIVDMSMTGGGTSSGGTGSAPAATATPDTSGGVVNAPGMPSTGNGDGDRAFVLALVLLALSLTTIGVRLARRRA